MDPFCTPFAHLAEMSRRARSSAPSTELYSDDELTASVAGDLIGVSKKKRRMTEDLGEDIDENQYKDDKLTVAKAMKNRAIARRFAYLVHSNKVGSVKKS